MAAVAATLTERVELPPVVTDVGLSVAVTPAGAAPTARLIVSAVPETIAVLIVLQPEVP